MSTRTFTIGYLAWSAIGGAVIATTLGFTVGGWVTGATARKLAAEQSSAAVGEVLAPSCVARFKAAGDDLAAFKDKSSWSQSSYLTEKKYAPDSNVANACVALLTKEPAKG